MSSQESQCPDGLRKRSPVGGWESLLWTGAYAISQLVAVSITLGLIGYAALGRDVFSQQKLLDLFIDLDVDRSFLVFGVATLGSVLILAPLVRWRSGPTWREDLKLRLPSGRHTLLLVGSVLPLSILSNELYRYCLSWIGPAVSDTNQLARSMSLQESYPILVVALALGPAVGEELVFRGLIGRGLIQKWGVPGGVILTAALFALAHLTPAHAIATLPLGLFLHWIYLRTQSLWAPILLHFLNNLLVISMDYFHLDEIPASPFLIATAFGCLTALAWRFGTEEIEGANETPGRPLAGPFWQSWQLVYEGWSVLAYTTAFVWSV